jgi:hypothetical protein
MATAIIIAQFAIQYGIPAAQELTALFQKPNPTVADWQVVWDKAKTPLTQGLNAGAVKA